MSNLKQDIKVVTYGTIEDKLAGTAIVLNQEIVTPAQLEGRFENMIQEGGKTGKGSLLGYFVSSQGQTPLRAQMAGIFMRQTDGLEEVLRNINLQTVGPEVFKYKTHHISEDQKIMTGQAVYKIVDNLEPTRLMLHFPFNDVDFEVVLNQQANVFLKGNDLGKAKVVDVKRDFEELLMILEFNGFNEELLNQRFAGVELVFDSQSGYLVPNKAVIEKDGEKGIFLAKGEDITFKPVKIIKSKGDISIIEGLNKNDLVVTNPHE
jgi:putative membrane fusion protein